MIEKRLISDVEFEKLYGIGAPTLRGWRFRGKGPRFLKIAGMVRYDVRDVEKYLSECASDNTAAATGTARK